MRGLIRSAAPGALTALLLLAGCAGAGRLAATSVPPVPETVAAPDRAAGDRIVTLLAVNDVRPIEGMGEAGGGLARLRTVRAQLEQEAPDLLVLFEGDLLFGSLLDDTYSGEPMIDLLNLLDGGAGFDDRMVSIFAGHDFAGGGLEGSGFEGSGFDGSGFDGGEPNAAAIVDRRVEQSDFLWLATNIAWTRNEDGEPRVASDHLLPAVLRQSGGVSVGIFGLTADLRHPPYIESFGEPVEAARRATADLRARGAELVVGLTHLGCSEYAALREALNAGGPDLILPLYELEWIADSARSRLVTEDDDAGRSLERSRAPAMAVRVTVGADGRVKGYGLEPSYLSPWIEEDPAMRAAVAGWLERLDRDYCREVVQAGPGCLAAAEGIAPEVEGRIVSSPRRSGNDYFCP